MVNLLEVMYVVTAGFALAAIVFLIRGRKQVAIWCAWIAFVGALSAAMLYVRLVPKVIAMVSGDPVIMLRHVNRPGATTITGLRRELNVAPLASCAFDGAKLTLDSARFLATDGLAFRLPPGWKETSRGVEEVHGDSIVQFANGDKTSRISVTRMPYVRGVGWATYYIGDSLGLIPLERVPEAPLEGRCETTDMEAGALWSFHFLPAARGAQSERYQGVGELMTVAGKRYQATVVAPSKSERDGLARTVSDAVITPGGPRRPQRAP